MNRYRAILTTMLMLVCLIWYIFPLYKIITIAFGDGGFGIYEPWLKSYYGYPGDNAADMIQLNNILSSVVAGAGISLAIKSKKIDWVNVLSISIIFIAVLSAATASYLLNSEIIISKGVIVQAYGQNVYDNLLKLTVSRFKEFVSLISVMLGFSIGKIGS